MKLMNTTMFRYEIRVFKYDPSTDSFIYGGSSRLYDRIMQQRNLRNEDLEKEIRARSLLLEKLAKSDSQDNMQINESIGLKQWKWMRG